MIFIYRVSKKKYPLARRANSLLMDIFWDTWYNAIDNMSSRVVADIDRMDKII